MKKITKFQKETTLKEAMDEMEKNGGTEITRIMNQDGVFTFEYNIN